MSFKKNVLSTSLRWYPSAWQFITIANVTILVYIALYISATAADETKMCGGGSTKYTPLTMEIYFEDANTNKEGAINIKACGKTGLKSLPPGVSTIHIDHMCTGCWVTAMCGPGMKDEGLTMWGYKHDSIYIRNKFCNEGDVVSGYKAGCDCDS